MEDRLVIGILVSILLISNSFSTFALLEVQGEGELVTMTSTSHQGVTVVEYKNSNENIFDVKSVVLEVDNGNFKSFKTENGWTGKKTSSDTLTFTSTNSIKPGQSVKFGIKTDKPDPLFNWKAFDEEGDELGSGESIVTIQQEIATQEDTKPKIPSGVLDDSSFKMIPTTIRVGSSLRVIGENFGPKENLDFYINNNKIDSFVTDENGNFILSTKIPANQQADRADFIVSDKDGNQKTISLRIQESSSRIVPQDIELTVKGDLVYHRGDEKVISGTATAGSTLTISIVDSYGQILTTYTVKADSAGNYSTAHKVPLDREFGDYIISVTDGKTIVFHPYTIETTQKIILLPLKQQYDPGETVVINGTALPDQEIQIIIEDPIGMEVYSKNFVVGTSGIVTLEYPLDSAAREGTYVVFATQGDEHEAILVGVGEPPAIQLIMTMSALNYKNTEQVIIEIIGPPSSTVSLVIVDPSTKQKFADSITIGPDGFYEYTFSLNEYSPGVYTAVLTRGNTQVEKRFSVGLETGSGPVNIRTVGDTYLPGQSLMLIGNSSPNVIITLTLKDPNGNKIKTTNVFTDKKGVFSSSVFRFPSDAQPGVWSIDAASGVNHVSKDLIVLAQAAEGIMVRLDKSPPAYNVDELITISGTGAGNSHSIIIKILGTNQAEIEELRIVATQIGSFNTIWKIPIDFNAGTYTIKVIDANLTAETTFTVQ